MSAMARARALTYNARRKLGMESDPRRPSRQLFGGIRRRLTLWYSTVLAAVLALSGLVLYLAVQDSLLSPINSQLQLDAKAVSGAWQANWVSFHNGIPLGPGDSLCPARESDPSLLIICYNRGEKTIAGQSLLAQYIPAFTNPALAKVASGNGSASDTIATGASGEFASVQRYATTVASPSGHGIIGVLQVGLPVGGQANALNTMLHLLLFLGGITVLLSLGGGLFLANRALQPARLAYTRQRDFIADASHELRTPLTMLRSSVEFVLRGRDHLQSDDIALLEDTVQETTHLTTLANSMLNLARLDSDEVHVEAEVVDLHGLAAEVVRWAQPLASERRITVEITPGDPVLVLADRSLLEQAILVLIDNSIKYNQPDGSVTTTVTREDRVARLIVADTGIGIAPEHLRRLGERFYRVDKARSRESGGAGLGLSIVRSIIARHSGTFGIESEEGKGTTATITMRAIRGDT